MGTSEPASFPAEIDGIDLDQQTAYRASNGVWWIAASIPVADPPPGGRQATAVLFSSADEGRTWSRVGLRLVWWQRLLARGMFSWPPESIDRIEETEGGIALYFIDPWTFEGAHKWMAHRLPGKPCRWRMIDLGFF